MIAPRGMSNQFDISRVMSIIEIVRDVAVFSWLQRPTTSPKLHVPDKTMPSGRGGGLLF